MKRRLSRVKAKIKATGIPFAVPDARLLPERVDACWPVVYLIFNEGYHGRSTSPRKPSAWPVLVAVMPDGPRRTGC